MAFSITAHGEVWRDMRRHSVIMETSGGKDIT